MLILFESKITTVSLHVIPHNCSEMHRDVAIPDYRSLVTQTSGMDICQIGYDICEFSSLRGSRIDIIGRVRFDNRDRFSISMGSIGKAIEPCQQTTEWLLTSDFLLFLEPWYARWYGYEIFIASCTDSIYDLENERWLFGDMIDHVGIYGSRVAAGLSTFNVGLVQQFMMVYFNNNKFFCVITLSVRLYVFIPIHVNRIWCSTDRLKQSWM